MLKTAIPSVYPAEGVFSFSTIHVDLSCATSGTFGSNRRYVPDTAWLQIGNCSLESSLRTLDSFLAAAKGKLRRIYTGHNDKILDANAYLRTLREALRKAVEQGEAALAPSLRSAAESFGSGTAAIEGDWRIDPIWEGGDSPVPLRCRRSGNPAPVCERLYAGHADRAVNQSSGIFPGSFQEYL